MSSGTVRVLAQRFLRAEGLGSVAGHESMKAVIICQHAARHADCALANALDVPLQGGRQWGLYERG
jgi:hypothetical protein